MKSTRYKRKKPASSAGENGSLKREIAPNLQALCVALGTTRDTYTRYRLHPKAPPKPHDGYDIVAWRDFLRAHGVTTNTERREMQQVSEIKSQIMQEDLDMRRIEKRKMLGQLIDRAEADERLVAIAAIFSGDLTNLRDRMSGMAVDGRVALIDVHNSIAECMANVRRQVQAQSFDRADPS